MQYESTTYVCDGCGCEESFEIGLEPPDWVLDLAGDYCYFCVDLEPEETEEDENTRP